MVSWSEWCPIELATTTAPSAPGVYQVRLGETGPIVYVGMAGERNGKGIRGRLRIYRTGKGAVSGLGEAAFNRALAEPQWIRDRLREAEAGRPLTAKEWARAALDHWDLHVCWAATADRDSALKLERSVIRAMHGQPLWNVRR